MVSSNLACNDAICFELSSSSFWSLVTRSSMSLSFSSCWSASESVSFGVQKAHAIKTTRVKAITPIKIKTLFPIGNTDHQGFLLFIHRRLERASQIPSGHQRPSIVGAFFRESGVPQKHTAVTFNSSAVKSHRVVGEINRLLALDPGFKARVTGSVLSGKSGPLVQQKNLLEKMLKVLQAILLTVSGLSRPDETLVPRSRHQLGTYRRYLRRKHPATKIWADLLVLKVLFSEVDVDMKIVQKSKHDTNPTTSRAILASDCILNLPPPEQRFSSL